MTRLGEDTPDQPQVFTGQSDVERRDQIVRRFEASTIRLSNTRADLPTGEPGLFGFNAWNANQPGSTLFIPVTNTTVEYMSLLFIYFDETHYVPAARKLYVATHGLGAWLLNLP